MGNLLFAKYCTQHWGEQGPWIRQLLSLNPEAQVLNCCSALENDYPPVIKVSSSVKQDFSVLLHLSDIIFFLIKECWVRTVVPKPCRTMAQWSHLGIF